MGSRRKQGELEAEVLAALWAADGPLTPEQVRGELGEQLAYTTVQTILVRLHAKSVIGREARGRSYAYAPLMDEAELAADRLRKLLDAERDLEGVLGHFVAALDERQAEALRRALEGGDR